MKLFQKSWKKAPNTLCTVLVRDSNHINLMSATNLEIDGPLYASTELQHNFN